MHPREMIGVRNAGRNVCAAAAALLAMGAPAVAQTARVYVANSANSRVLGVQFDPPSTFVVIDDANQLTQVRDIAVRDDGLDGTNLIVCDRNGGRIAFYENAFGTGSLVFDAGTMTGPERPDGMSLDLAGNIYVANSGQGSSAGRSEFWVIARDLDCPGGMDCLPGGYRAPLGLIDPDVKVQTQFGGSGAVVDAELLPESLVAPTTSGLLAAGDVLVLTNPGALIRYPSAHVGAFLEMLALGLTPAPLTPETIIHPAGASVPLERQFPAGAEPNGVAFGPRGEILVVMSDGRILIYGADGKRRSDGAGGFIDFATGGGNDDFKIAVGLQDSEHRAFVTQQGRGELVRYSFAADGTGVLDAVVGGFQSPVGVDTTNSSTVPAPTGSNVIVEPTTVMASRLEQVLQSGLVNGRVSTFADPREAEVPTPPDQPLHRPLLLSELRADLPPIEIPAWARAFPIDDPVAGTPTFILIETDTNASVAGLLDHLALQEPILGYDVDCNDPDLTRQPYLLWAPDATDPPIVEGDVFIDITSGCGSIRGLSWSYSYFLAGVRVTQPLPSLAGDKLVALRTMITGSTCIQQQLVRKLVQQLDRADRDFARGRYSKVADAMNEILNIVLASPQALNSCDSNTAGEIRARAQSVIHVVGKL